MPNVIKSPFYNLYNKFLDGGPRAREDRNCHGTWNKIRDGYCAIVIEVVLNRDITHLVS